MVANNFFYYLKGLVMPGFALAFLCGIVLLQNFSNLPAPGWIGSCILLALFCKATCWRYAKYLAGGLLGFAWCLWWAYMQLSLSLPSSFEGKILKVTGTIVSIPYNDMNRTRFLFNLHTIENKPSQGNVNLSWEGDHSQAHVGEQWQLTIKIKKVHSTLNPNGFDYEAYSFQQGTIASGYVVFKLPQTLLVTNKAHPIARLRQFFYDQLLTHLPASHTSAWIIALVVGERHGISPNEWRVLQNTGTNHLVAIAGLHIGFMSAFIYMIVAWAWRRLPWLRWRLPAQHAGAVAALGMALIYSMLAGFSLPTQRACSMLSMFLIISLLRRYALSWRIWALALLGVLGINPLTVLTESFWLSFFSVALIIYGMKGRLAAKGLWWQHGRIQWIMGVGLIPFTLFFFHQCSLVSFLANSIAVPWVGFCILPLTLCGSFLLLIFPFLGSNLLLHADQLLQLLWKILSYLAEFHWASWSQTVPHLWVLVAACFGVIFLLVPIGFPGRWLGLLWTLPLFLYQAPAPRIGEAWFTLLDVGQGLAAVIQTQNHILLFDAGEKFREDYDMGDSVVVPFLKSINTKKIDLLVVSHGDNDHIGGTNAVIQQFPVKKIQTSVPDKFPTLSAQYCLRGESWKWDEVVFDFIYPPRKNLGLGNDSSCVLRITVGKQRILLTGDIEKFSEKYLIKNDNKGLQATILVAPHHGSKTSALDQFIDYVNPDIVLFAIGYRNRYRFPHPSVVQKFKQRGIIIYDSVQGGAIQFYLDGQKKIPQPMLYRVNHKKYWSQF